jgi:HlyD family secretion protein
VKRRYIFVGLVLFICLAIGFKYLNRKKPIKVVVQDVTTGLVEYTVSNTRAGSVKARHRAKLAPTIGGRIATLNVRKGDRVKKEEILLTLWNNDLKADVQLARAQLDASEATARQTCLLADNAERQAQRQIELRHHGSTSESIYDDAVAEARAKRAACQAAEAQKEVGLAKVEAARAMLEKTILTAPFDGIVAEVNGEVGEYATPSPPGIPTLPAIDLINMGSLYVAAPIDEIDASEIKPGMETRITLDAFAKKIFKGKVRSISPYVLELAKQARTVEIEADFLDPVNESNLLVGYSADVEIVIDSRKDVMRIPTESVVEGGYVYVFHPDDNHIERRQIKTGLSNWRFTQVISGLTNGEKVVTTIDREGLADGVKAIIDITAQETNRK